jgi:hypothetical protein
MEDEVKTPVCTETPYEDVGHGVEVQKRYMDGALAGVAYNHARPDGSECPGGKGSWIPVKSGGSTLDGWDLVSESPLTLSPSLLCRVCGHHGFIRDGVWVPA